MAEAIELRDVSVRFGETRAVDSVSFAIAKGELVALLGASGCGKTTVLRTINRLVEPDGGRVLLSGRDVRELVPHELRRRVGYCFQRIGLFPHMSVAENVGITARLLGWPSERIAKRVAELLAMVELPIESYGERMPSQLSGGQAQRVGVARALCAEPEVVLFDEPFGALDPITREQLQAELRALRERIELSGVFVTHDVIEAIALGDRIGVMRDGRLLQLDKASVLRSAPADPYVARLLEAPERQRALLMDAP